MRAVVVHEFGPPGVLKVEQVPTPVIGDDEVFVRNHAAGVNRYDVELRSGIYSGQPVRELFFAKDLKFPLVLGVEPAGEIAEIGRAVPAAVKIGARVTIRTHRAEFASIAGRARITPARKYVSSAVASYLSKALMPSSSNVITAA
jgi:NADPH:quinone reductase-like Zn-dependent oxidoreductase